MNHLIWIYSVYLEVFSFVKKFSRLNFVVCFLDVLRVLKYAVWNKCLLHSRQSALTLSLICSRRKSIVKTGLEDIISSITFYCQFMANLLKNKCVCQALAVLIRMLFFTSIRDYTRTVKIILSIIPERDGDLTTVA